MYCYLEFKLRYHENQKLFSIRVKELFEPVLRRRVFAVFKSIFLRNRSLSSAVVIFTVKKHKIRKGNLHGWKKCYISQEHDKISHLNCNNSQHFLCVSLFQAHKFPSRWQNFHFQFPTFSSHGNLYLTENRLSWNEMCCAADNHNLYVSHMCKRIFRFELQLSSYWQNIKFSQYCPKFQIFTNIVIFKVYL